MGLTESPGSAGEPGAQRAGFVPPASRFAPHRRQPGTFAPGRRIIAALLLLIVFGAAAAVFAFAGQPSDPRPITQRTWFLVIAIMAITVQSFLLFLALFEPSLDYKISTPKPSPLESADFLRMIEAVTDAKVYRRTQVEVLANGEVYYEAELEAIRAAKQNINLEAYIFQKGRVARRFVEALAERARAGVRVNLLLDAIGSFATWDRYLRELTDAGGRLAWYHPIRWYSLARMNNRTHRELIIVDGRVGFLGGAGFADHWFFGRRNRRRWRDSMYRVEGDAVASLQATFVENWLEGSGEILTGNEYFPLAIGRPGVTAALVVNSSPSAGRSTPARILFQTLLAGAQKSILITTPYFLPDHSVRAELCRAIQERGVEVSVIAPGKHADHLLTRRSSRRLYGELLKAGAKIYEYKPAMLHAKALVVDGIWTVVGSTNFDHRSFGLNDEVNLAAFDAELGARLTEDFARDRAESRLITYKTWRLRFLHERLHEYLGWLFERQQ